MDIYENCKCYYLQYPKVPNTNVKPCLNTTELLCASNEYRNFIEKNIQKYTKVCPLECNDILFDFVLSSSDFPTPNWYEIQKNNKHFLKKYFNNNKNISFERVKKKIMAVRIFYPHLKFTSIIELKKITFIDLLSGIGGTFSLFCGMSILNLLKYSEKILRKFLKLKKFFNKF